MFTHSKIIHLLSLLVLISVFAVSLANPVIYPQDDARRISVLFVGAPTKNSTAHNPITRYQVIKKHLGADGIDFTYTEDPAIAFDPDTLKNYDTVLLYGNWEQHGSMPATQERALLDYVNQGGGFVPVHCASACYGKSDAFVNLVGARFKSHGSGVFSPTNVSKKHSILVGTKPVFAWDETYVHDRHAKDKTILQKRDNEPWTWIRNQGKGKVFYTASGHDLRVWDQPDFHQLIKQGVLWTAGKISRAKLRELNIPEMKYAKAQLPGYLKRKTIEEYQEPMSPTDSMKHVQVPTGFEISLFASEPEIINPIAINWDNKGRAFVVETIDYPNQHHAGNVGNDRIKICEDTNNDGRADKFTVFADELSLATSLVHAYGGVICTNGTELLFLKDSSGDGKADIRKPLFKGFSMRDTHAGPSNLRWGYDSWIYATVGYSGFKGQVGGNSYDFRTGVYRFRVNGNPEREALGKDGSLQQICELEFLQNTTNNTWGLGITEEFDVLNSTANANTSAYLTLPRADYDRVGLKQPQTPRADNNPTFFPSSKDIRQVDVHNGYTAAAGHAFYTGRLFPQSYWNNIAFVCAPTGKLVSEFQVAKNGSGFISTQRPNNIYNSSDTWSAPVAAEVGPDGAVWVCDWYNIIIQHNPTPTKRSAGFDGKKGKGNAYVTPLRDKQHGRIYRIYPKGSVAEVKSVNSVDEACSILRSNNDSQFWQISAQRKIIDEYRLGRISSEKVKELGGLITNAEDTTVAQIHTLHELGQLNEPTIASYLSSSDPAVRRAAIRCAPKGSILESTFIKGTQIKEKDPRVLVELFLAFSQRPSSEQIARAIEKFEIGTDDIALKDAFIVAQRAQAAALLLIKAESDSADVSVEMNLLANPKLDSQEGWAVKHYSGDKAKMTHSKTEGRNGGGCLKIVASKPADCGWIKELKVKPNTSYKFGGFIKTENLKVLKGKGVLFNVHNGNTSDSLKADSDWTEFSFSFDTHSNQKTVLVHCLFGGYGGAIGTAYFDDLYFYELRLGDASQTSDELIAHIKTMGTVDQKNQLLSKLPKIETTAAKMILRKLKISPVEVVKTRKHPMDKSVHMRGKAYYSKTCIACHGEDGKGVPPAFPPLDNSDWVKGDPVKAVAVLVHGLQGKIEVNGKPYNGMMPALANITDQEIADVLTYVRQSWSNDLPAVTLLQVQAARSKYQKQQEPLRASDL